MMAYSVWWLFEQIQYALKSAMNLIFLLIVDIQIQRTGPKMCSTVWGGKWSQINKITQVFLYYGELEWINEIVFHILTH